MDRRSSCPAGHGPSTKLVGMSRKKEQPRFGTRPKKTKLERLMNGWKVVLSRAKQPVRIHRSVTSRTFYLDDSKQEGSREKAGRTRVQMITDEPSKIERYVKGRAVLNNKQNNGSLSSLLWICTANKKKDCETCISVQ
jgi:hypothetical protein